MKGKTFQKTALWLMLCGLFLTQQSAFAFETVPPVTGAMPDFQYADDTRAISICQVSQNDVTYYVADVQLAEAADFHTALSGGKPNGGVQALSDIVGQTNAVLAINGDDYGTHGYGTIIRNGALIRAKNTTRNMLIVDANGDFSVRVDRRAENPSALAEDLIAKGVMQTFEFGPELIRNGEAVAFSDAFDLISTSPWRREPRTAIGQIGPLHYLLIVVDGRQEGYSIGISLQDLQQVFISYGVKTAINLDGGGSAEMWFQGSIINQPSGGGERRISDIICF